MKKATSLFRKILSAALTLMTLLLLVCCSAGDGDGGDTAPPVEDGEHVCDFSQKVAEDKYLKSAATCTMRATYYYSCTCGKKGEKAFGYGVAGSHDFKYEIPTKKYLVSEATMESPALYARSCECGYGGKETFEYESPLLVEDGLLYTPTSVTVTLYSPAEYIYGFTYSSEKQPIDPVIQIKKAGEEEWTDYAPTTTAASSLDSSDNAITYYVSKAEVALRPYGSYVYRICDRGAGVYTSEISFRTKNASVDSFTFVHVGDSQDGPVQFGQVLAAVADKADFLIHTGDVVQYSKYEHLWQEMLDTNSEYLSRLPIMAISGNHEVSSSYSGRDHDTFKHFNNNLPTQTSTKLGYFYSFVYGNVKFIMLNTNELTSNQLKPKQYDWLVKELSENKCRWTVVAMHNPLYSVGKYGANPDRNAIALALRQQLQGIFAEYGVDLVLQGHDHAISRTYPIDASGNPMAERLEKIGGIDYTVDPDGVIYVMNGPAGTQTRSPYAIDESLYSYAEKSNKASWAEITVDGDTLTVTVKYYDGVSENIYHTWGIKKS